MTDERNVDHQGLEVLSAQECLDLAAATPVGRIAFVEAGEPMVFPVNHAVANSRIYFRSALGALLHEAVMEQSVAFEADEFDAATRTGWSILVRGKARVAAPDEVAGIDLEPWADAIERDEWVSIFAEETSGRRITRG